MVNWDTDKVANSMKEMFRTATKFNQPIGDWNVFRSHQHGQNVPPRPSTLIKALKVGTPVAWSNMEQFFPGASSTYNMFNHSTDWNVSSVTDMKDIFKVATSFNQPIGLEIGILAK